MCSTAGNKPPEWLWVALPAGTEEGVRQDREERGLPRWQGPRGLSLVATEEVLRASAFMARNPRNTGWGWGQRGLWKGQESGQCTGRGARGGPRR